jgi:hypothetical protein
MTPLSVCKAVTKYIIRVLEDPNSSDDKLALIPKLIEATFKGEPLSSFKASKEIREFNE